MATDPETAAWHATAVPRFNAALDGWSLELAGEPFPGGTASIVAPVRDPHGRAFVLKVQWPHPECRHEADALESWAGHGAVRLVARDDPAGALLMQRCVPGTTLASRPHGEVLDVLVELTPKLWVDAGAVPFDTQADSVRAWAAEIEEHRDEMEAIVGVDVLDRIPTLAHELEQPSGPQVLSHQDLHPANVVLDDASGWLAIDPKPIVGDHECGVIAIVRSTLLGFEVSAVRARIDLLAIELGLDRGRMRDLALLQVLAWSTDGPNAERHQRSGRALASL